MKQNKHDEHVALGMIVAYAAGMVIMAVLVVGYNYTRDAGPSVSQANTQCLPSTTTTAIIQQETGQEC